MCVRDHNNSTNHHHHHNIMIKIILCTILLIGNFHCVQSVPDQGRWMFIMDKEMRAATIPKSLFAGSEIFVDLSCDSRISTTRFTIQWQIYYVECWPDTRGFYRNLIPKETNETFNIRPQSIEDFCSTKLPEFNSISVQSTDHDDPSNETEDSIGIRSKSSPKMDRLIYTIPEDGIYMFVLIVQPENEAANYMAPVYVEMRGPHGYLSAADWPLLPFYGVMFSIFALFLIVWIWLSWTQRRDLLRIQFWIGAVILFGLIENALFFAEYHNVNATGKSTRYGLLLAECASSAKFTLARMLLIIISLGYGIVRPSLSAVWCRIAVVGALYFALACAHSYLRAINVNGDSNDLSFAATVPLAFLNLMICCWISESSLQTIRTLKSNGNVIKLKLYRNFAYALILGLIAWVLFIVYSIIKYRLVRCLTDWEDLWLDEAFANILFAFLLLVIIILWRPTNKCYQQYAFTRLSGFEQKNKILYATGVLFDAEKSKNRTDPVMTQMPANEFLNH